jgi:hypothetical protein
MTEVLFYNNNPYITTIESAEIGEGSFVLSLLRNLTIDQVFGKIVCYLFIAKPINISSLVTPSPIFHLNHFISDTLRKEEFL